MSLLANKTRDEMKALRARAEQFAVSNHRDGYDSFWSDDEIVELYLEPGRIENFRQVAKRCAHVGGVCIDLGCGEGTMLRMLADDISQARTLYGLDYTTSAIVQSRKRVPQGHFSVGNVHATGFANDTFDLALSIQTMEHLNEPAKAACEMWRILKPGGVAIITVPNGAVDAWEGHVNFWTPESFVEMFGHTPIAIEYLNNNRNLLFEFRKGK